MGEVEEMVWCAGGKVGVLQDGIGCWPGGLEWGGGEGKIARGGLSEAVNGGWACEAVGREKVGMGGVSKAAGLANFGLTTSLSPKAFHICYFILLTGFYKF